MHLLPTWKHLLVASSVVQRFARYSPLKTTRDTYLAPLRRALPIRIQTGKPLPAAGGQIFGYTGSDPARTIGLYSIVGKPAILCVDRAIAQERGSIQLYYISISVPDLGSNCRSCGLPYEGG